MASRLEGLIGAPDWAHRPSGSNSAPSVGRNQVLRPKHWAFVVTTTLGERMQLARKRAGLSQTQLATAIGLGGEGDGRSTVSNWENDKTMPDSKYLVQLPDVLGVSADWLLYARTDRGGVPIPSREVAEELRAWLDRVYPPEGKEGTGGGGGSEG